MQMDSIGGMGGKNVMPPVQMIAKAVRDRKRIELVIVGEMQDVKFAEISAATTECGIVMTAGMVSQKSDWNNGEFNNYVQTMSLTRRA
jgi:hypothetical protein